MLFTLTQTIFFKFSVLVHSGFNHFKVDNSILVFIFNFDKD